MKKHLFLHALCTTAMIIMLSALNANAAAPPDPCVDCHTTETPGVVEEWKRSKHSINEVECQLCHLAGEGDPSAVDHHGSSITKDITIAYCEGCHALAYEIMEESRDKKGNFLHAPLK